MLDMWKWADHIQRAQYWLKAKPPRNQTLQHSLTSFAAVTAQQSWQDKECPTHGSQAAHWHYGWLKLASQYNKAKKWWRTGWVLDFHHQSLKGVQGLKLLLLITQVFLQQTGPHLKLFCVQLKPVAIWNEPWHEVISETADGTSIRSDKNKMKCKMRLLLWGWESYLQVKTDWHTDVISARTKRLEAIWASSKLAWKKSRMEVKHYYRHHIILLIHLRCFITHLDPVFDLLVARLVQHEDVQLFGELFLGEDPFLTEFSWLRLIS